ncbi:shikimate kinase [Desulfonauticus submarinus]|uniref:Shikimate kinase n=1 Tax=Desulfonauticus submarinus TaxID=206665 RepID=A0A1H0BTX7_9BACT|nr:shikimate kinase AroL [Desulfonauticus submarinus]SDN49078.1 shikimate kinase [Desulfonauticus submarinus]
MGKQVKQNIYLLGPRACGKSTIGKIVAKKIGKNFVDLDVFISKQEGKSILDIIQNKGWNYFREIESKALFSFENKDNLVLATGGGIILKEKNRVFLKSQKYTFYLKIDIDTAIKRLLVSLDKENRPPLTNLSLEEEVKKVMQERENYYLECARYIIDARQLPEQIGEEIKRKIKNEWR